MLAVLCQARAGPGLWWWLHQAATSIQVRCSSSMQGLVLKSMTKVLDAVPL
jgi:hypothetical protein